jgi:hypothetical protein
VCATLGGKLADLLIARGADVTRVRKTFLATSFGVPAVCLWILSLVKHMPYQLVVFLMVLLTRFRRATPSLTPSDGGRRCLRSVN